MARWYPKGRRLREAEPLIRNAHHGSGEINFFFQKHFFHWPCKEAFHACNWFMVVVRAFVLYMAVSGSNLSQLTLAMGKWLQPNGQTTVSLKLWFQSDFLKGLMLKIFKDLLTWHFARSISSGRQTLQLPWRRHRDKRASCSVDWCQQTLRPTRTARRSPGTLLQWWRHYLWVSPADSSTRAALVCRRHVGSSHISKHKTPA